MCHIECFFKETLQTYDGHAILFQFIFLGSTFYIQQLQNYQKSMSSKELVVDVGDEMGNRDHIKPMGM